MDERAQAKEMVDFLLRKSQGKDEKVKKDSLSLIGDVKRDPETKPDYMLKDKDSLKKVEDITKKIQEKVK
ncbi:MAG: hypothetical protein V1663_00960 [archaeon]